MSEHTCGPRRDLMTCTIATDEALRGLRGIADLLCPVQPKQDLEMVQIEHLHHLVDIMVKHLARCLDREREARR